MIASKMQKSDLLPVKQQKKLDIAALNRILQVQDPQHQLQVEAIQQWYTNSSAAAVELSQNRVFDALLNLGDSGIKCIMDCGLLDTVQKRFSGLNSMTLDQMSSGDIKSHREVGILLIRYYILSGKLDMAMELFRRFPRELTRKRHAQLLLQAHAETCQWKTATDLFSLIIKHYPQPGVQAEDILPFLRPNAEVVLSEILVQVLEQPIYMGDLVPDSWGLRRMTIPYTEHEHEQLRKLAFSSEQLQELTDNLDNAFKAKGMKNPPKPDLSKHYDYVVDGANVLFYAERAITANGYRRISRMLKALRDNQRDARILLVLHERHFNPKGNRWLCQDAFKEIKFWRSLRNLDICQTPPSFNDDHYSLLNTFPRPEALLVTNDKFRDHIHKLSSKDHNLDLVGAWRQEKVIEYDMHPKSGPVSLFMPPPYSFRVQKGAADGHYYLPIRATDMGTEWYCL